MEKRNEMTINNSKHIIFGLLIGALAGATAMLLFAPQSGRQTRDQIQLKSEELMNKTNEFVKDSVKQVQRKTEEISSDIKQKVGQLKESGKEKLVKGIDQVSDVLDDGKDAVEGM